MTQSLLKIGEVAEASGLTVKTVRYYEEIGLLRPTVMRSDSGYRLFDPIVLNRLAFIKRAQSLGLALTEINDILQVRDRGELPCGEVKHHLQGKVQAISQQIHDLTQLRAELESVLSGWQDHPTQLSAAQVICPNIQV